MLGLRIQVITAQQTNTLSLEELLVIPAQKGATYTLIDAASNKPVTDMLLKRDGDTLVVEVDCEVVAQIEQFYDAGQAATFNVGELGSAGELVSVGSADTSILGSDIVWQATGGCASGSESDDASSIGLGTVAMGVGALAVGGLALFGAGGGSQSESTAATSNIDVVDTSVVVFDLVEGVSSDHSGRSFDANVDYTIYIRVDSNSATLNKDGNGALNLEADWGTWSGADNLTATDIVVLVGDDSFGVIGESGNKVTAIGGSGGKFFWLSGTSTTAAIIGVDGGFGRFYSGSSSSIDLWNGSGPNNLLTSNTIGSLYRVQFTGNTLATQGLTQTAVP
jgi:hypothetical protein